jgi:hypothetical protein
MKRKNVPTLTQKQISTLLKLAAKNVLIGEGLSSVMKKSSILMVQMDGNAIGTTWTVSLNSFPSGNLVLVWSWFDHIGSAVREINSSYFTREIRFGDIQAHVISPSSPFCR